MQALRTKVSYFFVKTLSSFNSASSSWYNNIQCKHLLCALHFQCHEKSLCFFNGKWFLCVTSSKTPLSFLWQPLSSFMSVSLPSDKKVNNQVLLSVHELNNKNTVPSHQQALKEVTWLVADDKMYLSFIIQFVYWRATSKVCALGNYLELIYW